MLSIAYYFLQVVLCSGMMMGYYWLVLRNKRFHQYNRFYLLGVGLLSWIVPLIKIRWSHPAESLQPQMMQFLSVVADNNSQIEENIVQKGFDWNWNMVATAGYLLVAGILLLAMLIALFRLYRLLKIHPCKNVGEVYLILTQAKGTPFSFFRYIFWNEEIDIRSEAGRQILEHELTHVQQKHSFDKLFIQVILIIGWFNPFFWLLRKEMDMIHEFIADKKAVHNGDTASLAQMLLTAAYPQQQFALTHPFFFSPIKRRLKMLTNNKHPRFTYMRRLIVLPLLAVVVILFAFRNKEQRANSTLSVASVVETVVNSVKNGLQPGKQDNLSVFNEAILDRTYTVIIDAGHGGTDKGVIGADGTSESQITLALAKMINELNANEGINIVLTRETDVYQTVKEKAALANQYHPDLFVSLHCNDASVTANNKEDKNLTGIEFFIPGKGKAASYAGSESLANYLSTSVGKLNEKMFGIKSRNRGIWVLENVQSPAVLVEAGFITNKNDLEKLKNTAYQKQMANAVLQGINNYLANLHRTIIQRAGIISDTIADNTWKQINPSGNLNIKTEGPSILHQGVAKDAFGNILRNRKFFVKDILYQGAKTVGAKVWEETHEVISDNEGIFTIKIGRGDKSSAIKLSDLSKIEWTQRPFYVNIQIAVAPVSEPNWRAAENNYVDLGTVPLNVPYTLFNGDDDIIIGVINNNIPLQSVTDSSYKENPGMKEFRRRNPDVKQVHWNNQPLKIIIQLKDGTEETYDLSKPESKKRAENKYGKLPFAPPLPPSTLQPTITSVENPGNSGAIFTQVQVPAEFPGGLAAWTKYLQRNLDTEIPAKNGAPPGKYTVIISFIVDKTGNLSDLKALNDPGYGTKEEAIRMIVKGPKWKPAVRNGSNVNYLHKQSITFLVTDPTTKLKIVDIDLTKLSDPSGKGHSKTIDLKAFDIKLQKAKANNEKIFFTIDGSSCVSIQTGTSASIDATTDIIIVNGKRMSPGELNSKYKRSDFVVAAASDSKATIKKFGKGVLLVSSAILTPKEIQTILEKH